MVRSVAGRVPLLRSWFKSVSYTHLDVYKRQDQRVVEDQLVFVITLNQSRLGIVTSGDVFIQPDKTQVRVFRVKHAAGDVAPDRCAVAPLVARLAAVGAGFGNGGIGDSARFNPVFLARIVDAVQFSDQLSGCLLYTSRQSGERVVMGLVAKLSVGWLERCDIGENAAIVGGGAG